MKVVYLSNSDIVDAVNFAVHTVSNHFHRMWSSEEEGIQKIVAGKLGEIAVLKYCDMTGRKVKRTNFKINTGVDTADMIINKKNVAIKTKIFSRSVLPQLNEIFLHVPCDQYPKMVENETKAIIAVCLRSNVPKDTNACAHVTGYKTNIVGGLPFDTFAQIKVLHKVGEEISPGFLLPPPASYGVRWSDLWEIEKLLIHLKEYKTRDTKQLYLCEEAATYSL